MNVDVENTRGMTPDLALARLKALKQFQGQSGPIDLGLFGFSDVFQVAWQTDPFKVSMCKFSDAKGSLELTQFDLPNNWLEGVIDEMALDPEKLGELSEVEFVCLFRKNSLTEDPELTFMSLYSEEMKPWLANAELSNSRAMEGPVSQLGSVKVNAWF